MGKREGVETRVLSEESGEREGADSAESHTRRDEIATERLPSAWLVSASRGLGGGGGGGSDAGEGGGGYSSEYISSVVPLSTGRGSCESSAERKVYVCPCAGASMAVVLRGPEYWSEAGPRPRWDGVACICICVKEESIGFGDMTDDDASEGGYSKYSMPP
jgi:hypothetical protein